MIDNYNNVVELIIDSSLTKGKSPREKMKFLNVACDAVRDDCQGMIVRLGYESNAPVIRVHCLSSTDKHTLHNEMMQLLTDIA